MVKVVLLRPVVRRTSEPWAAMGSATWLCPSSRLPARLSQNQQLPKKGKIIAARRFVPWAPLVSKYVVRKK